MERRKVERNYDLLSSCSWYVPGIGGMFSVLGMFLLGMALAAIVVAGLSLLGIPLIYEMLIMYPIQFIPVFIYVRLKSQRNAFFDSGFALDSNHFGKIGGWRLAVMAGIGAVAAAIVLEAVNSLLPDLSENLKKTLETLMNGPLWVSLLSVSVMAPILEEWMCRGVVLRGLLNYGRKDKEGNSVKGMNPALAIVISAIFFAAIHGNLWQGVTAFFIGCLLGYVYYRTGSLKLTMLMHCVNNTLSTLLSRFGGEEVSQAKSLLDLMPVWEYILLFCISVGILIALSAELSKIELQRPQGNCDTVPSAGETFHADKFFS